MKIYSVTDPEFKPYGRVVTGLDAAKAEILANVLGIPLTLPQTEQGPGYGGAMLAAVACGAYPSVQTCAEVLVHAKSTTMPDPALVEKYHARYAVWHKLYPALKASFAEMEALQ